MATLQEQYWFSGPRRQAYASSAANTPPGPWQVDPSTGSIYFDNGVGPRIAAPPDDNPKLGMLNHAILSGLVIFDANGGLIVKSTGQQVGLINGDIVLPGDAPVVAPPPPVTNKPDDGSFMIKPIASTDTGTGGGFTAADRTMLTAIASLLGIK